jgi:hypothetical protein
MLTSNTSPTISQPGRVTAVRGPVIEAEFAENDLPCVHEALRLRTDGRELIVEVSNHLSPTSVRAILLGHPEGLARGMSVERTGGPLRVPVGPSTLGRLFNVLGAPLDGRPGPPSTVLPPAPGAAPTGGVSPDGRQGHRPARPPRPRREGWVDRGGPGWARRSCSRNSSEPCPTAGTGSRCSPASGSGRGRGTTCGWRCSRPVSSSGRYSFSAG